METKTCSITEDEIKSLIIGLAQSMNDDNIEECLDRMNYLNRRLKAEKKEVATPVQTPTEQKAATGW